MADLVLSEKVWHSLGDVKLLACKVMGASGDTVIETGLGHISAAWLGRGDEATGTGLGGIASWAGGTVTLGVEIQDGKYAWLFVLGG